MFNKDLLFNSLSNTHDPLEFLDYSAVTLDDKIRSDERISEEINMISSINVIFKTATKIACFSADVVPKPGVDPSLLFGKGFCRSRMWSQYADAHRGVCLIFDRNILIDSVNDHIKTLEIKPETSINLDTNYVTYDNKLPGLSSALSNDPFILNESQ